MSKIARYRCENEMKGGHYWRKEKKICRIYEKGEKSDAILRECEATRDEMSIEEFLNKERKRIERNEKDKRVEKRMEKETKKIES